VSQLHRSLHSVIGGLSHKKSHSKLFAVDMGWDEGKLLKVSKCILKMKTSKMVDGNCFCCFFCFWHPLIFSGDFDVVF